jgi:S-adenosylmethionine/arginine decarboxylase-like enzyme
MPEMNSRAVMIAAQQIHFCGSGQLLRVAIRYMIAKLMPPRISIVQCVRPRQRSSSDP